MPFLRRIPRPPLSDFVAMIWYHEGQPVPHKKERLLPTGTIELIINLDEDQTRVYDRKLTCHSLDGVALCGIHAEYFVIDTEEQERVLGVHFHSGGAWPFLGVPARELQNLHLSAGDLWGSAARDLRTEILAASTLKAKFDIVEQFLWKKLAQCTAQHPAVTFALREMRKPSCRVGDVTNAIGLSQRHFIEVFADRVGLTPKVYSRIMRFQAAVQRIALSDEDPDWTEIALNCGYFDQAHFINDFRAFSGINPTTYLAKCNQHLNHVPMEESE